jgi:hypothetical protein
MKVLANCNLCKHFSLHSFCFIFQKRIPVHKRERQKCVFFLTDDLPKHFYYIEDEFEDFETEIDRDF